MKSFKTRVGGRTIEFQKRDWAMRASGEVLVKSGETQVLVTVVMEEEESDLPYFPLMVNYEERYYARGEIMGSRYVRREGKPTTNAVLVARAIDRTIRPLFPKWMRRDIQIIATCLSWDGKNDPDLLAMLGASFGLHLSPIPWQGPVGVIRISAKNGSLEVNPTYGEREGSEADIIFCGLEEEGEILVNMVEGEGVEAEEAVFARAAEKALPVLEKLIALQEKAREKAGEEKRKIERPVFKEVEKKVEARRGKMEKVLFRQEKGNKRKEEQLSTLKEETIAELKAEYRGEVPGKELEQRLKYGREVFEKELSRLVRDKAFEGKRIDGRGLRELRGLECEAGPVSGPHGSGLFRRGLTTSLSILTLGGPDDQKLVEGMEIVGKKRFLHHYNFPPYSVGESKPLRAPGRRELGHGMLGEKALRPVIPDFDDFPYTIRSVSEILTSNGSTSQSAICSTSLALMEAGVPIERPVAGIALGLARKKEEYKILTDIQGQEDFHGAMDLKVAGTRKGITVVQMDVKVRGIPLEVLKRGFSRAKEARLEILKEMEKEIRAPREELAPSAPQVAKTHILPEKIGLVIGGGGKTIKSLTEETGAEINIEDCGDIYVTAEKKESIRQALSRIRGITREIEEGEQYTGEVTKTLPFGVIVALSGEKDGLLHQSKYKRKPRRGEKLRVKVLNVDPSGKVDLDLVRKNE